MSHRFDDHDEWLEADGLGGFASGTVSGRRTRRYHALLLAAASPPTGRIVLVNGFDAWIRVGDVSYSLSSQSYVPGVVHPDGHRRIESFEPEPWPRWTFRLENGLVVAQEIFVPHETPAVAVRWQWVERPGDGTGEQVSLHVRPFLSGRDYHSLHHENPAFRFEAETAGDRVPWPAYAGSALVSQLFLCRRSGPRSRLGRRPRLARRVRMEPCPGRRGLAAGGRRSCRLAVARWRVGTRAL